MLIILAGLPATGKTTAKRFLKDIGYLAVENIGLDIVQKTMVYQHPLDSGQDKQVYTIGLAEADPQQVCEYIRQIRMQKEDVDVVYFEASEEVMYSRIVTMQYNTEQSFSSIPSIMGLAEKRLQNQPVKAMADLAIDSGLTDLTQMRHLLLNRYIGDAFSQQKIIIEITTFSYQCGMIRDANLVLDLRPIESGTPEAQADYSQALLSNCIPLIRAMLAQLEAFGSTRFCIGLGGSTEQTLPRRFAKELQERMRKHKLITTLMHRDLPPEA